MSKADTSGLKIESHGNARDGVIARNIDPKTVSVISAKDNGGTGVDWRNAISTSQDWRFWVTSAVVMLIVAILAPVILFYVGY